MLSLLPEALRQLGSLRRHVALEEAGRVLHGGGEVAQLEHELLHVVQLEERPLLGAQHAQGEAEEGPQRTSLEAFFLAMVADAANLSAQESRRRALGRARCGLLQEKLSD